MRRLDLDLIGKPRNLKQWLGRRMPREFPVLTSFPRTMATSAKRSHF